jgi:hypothetical protein
MKRPMRAMLAVALKRHYTKPPGDSLGERVVHHLVDKATGGDVGAMRLIFAVMDGPCLECEEMGSPAVLDRPLVDVVIGED